MKTKHRLVCTQNEGISTLSAKFYIEMSYAFIEERNQLALRFEEVKIKEGLIPKKICVFVEEF